MTKIKFGTDGWRAIIAEDFTTDNVARVAEAVAAWLEREKSGLPVVVGYDFRFGGKLFADVVAKVMTVHGIKCLLSDRMVSTPVVSLATLEYNAGIGIIITASHNPPEYNGFKLKADFGGPMPPDKVSEIESLIPETNRHVLSEIDLPDQIEQGRVERCNFEENYISKIESSFDITLLRKASGKFAYDAMYGAGQDVMKRLLPDLKFFHAEQNPGFAGIPPEPIHRNLTEFSDFIRNAGGSIECGLATDGDADRLGLYDEKGTFVDSHHIILLIIKYLVEEKKLNGKVVNAFSVSPRVKKLCDHYGIPYQVVKIGFKYVAEIMVREDVLLGGEESGGIAIKTHIPERDGIWMGLTIWEYMAKSGKRLTELIDECYQIVGSFAFERIDLHLREQQKVDILKKCEDDGFRQFGKFKVISRETIDGFKYFLEDDQWVMIRPSGTEPVLRTYAESRDRESALKLLEETHRVLLDNN